MSVEILLTGANGQVGWEVERRAATHGVKVRALARNELDISDRAAVKHTIAEHAPKVVINAAAYTAVDKAESEKDLAFAVNRDGAAHVAEACAASGASLIHFSTDYVFDGAKSGPYVETDPVNPVSVYGASKLAGEDAIRTAAPRHIILRTAWVYGVHGHNFVKTMLRLGRERPELRVVDDQRGCPTFAGDLADAALALARRALAGSMTEGGYGTFHCVGSGEVTWCGFTRKIIGLAGTRLGQTPKITAITTADYPTPARRPANSVLDSTKLARVHGLTLRPWPEALAEMLDTVLDGEQHK
ncbi:MAG: dTDP-4-dehydrorhamnose reductase [Rhodobacteraceae bacterium]|nr:dTDP-4-dehydrorhamnose reductase [Paracoccaceae bacterium]